MLDRLISISGREYDREIIKYGLIAMGKGVLSVLIILMCGVIEKRVFESFILANVILKLAEVSAQKAASVNSPWNYYQPKEPKKIKKYIF